MREVDSYSVSMLKANALSALAAGPVAAALAVTYAARWGAASLVSGVYGLLEPWILVLAVLPGIAAHELIHAGAWAVAARRPVSAMQLGFNWRSLTPYARPRAPLPARAYRIGAAMPVLLLGVVPALAAIAIGTPRIMAWGLFFVFTAGGDLLVLWLIREVPGDRLVEDHASRVGCRVLGEAAALATDSGRG